MTSHEADSGTAKPADADLHLRVLQSAAMAVNEACSVDEAVQSCLDVICTHCAWPVGHYYRRSDERADELVPSGVWHLDDPQRFDAFRRVTNALRLNAGQDVPGRVAASGKSVWIGDIGDGRDFPRAPWAAPAGIRGAYVLPVVVTSEVVGVLEFFWTEAVTTDAALLGLVDRIAGLLGRVVERARTAIALEQSEERMRLVIETAGHAFIGMDERGVITDWNIAAERTLGWTRQETLGRRLADTVIPLRYRAAHDQGLARYLATGEAPIFGRCIELEALHRDGHELPMELSVWPVRRGRSVQFNAFVNDISERRRTEAALLEAKELFQTAFDNAPIGMALTDLTGKFLQANLAYREMLGYSSEALMAMTFRDLTPADDLEPSLTMFERVVAGEVRAYRLEKRYLHADGHVVWVLLSVSAVSSPDGNLAYLIGQIEEISERKAAEAKLTRQALHDSLTGLPNRSLLVDRLHQALGRAARGQGSVTVMFLDLDHFKLINDSLGHEAGDRVLVMIAERLQAAVRPADTAARLGGDEFVILCEGLADESEARAMAARLEEAVGAPCMLGGEVVTVTASVGLVLAGSGSTTPEGLLRQADAAMYRAKQRGKARHEVFDDALRHLADQRLMLERDLREAFETGGLRLEYQPIVDLTTNAVVGLEALIRYWDAAAGPLDAEQFIHVAEDSGLIIPVGTWVLEQACRDAATWPGQGWCLPVTVNLGSRQMAWANLVPTVLGAVEAAGLDPTLLTLDLPEVAVAHAAGSTVKSLTGLREWGVRLGIGDFGTGEGSVACLRRLPVDFAKIDRSIVADLGTDHTDSAAAASLIAMGNALGLTTVALGVETAAQLAAVRDLGCALAQGNLLATPQPPDLLPAALAENHRLR